MKIDANDPRWTAYALGEITDEREKAEMENILRESAEMRELVEEIRQTAGLLKEELQAEPSIPLTQDQRERIEAKANRGRRWFGLKPAWAVACAAAAVVLVSFVSLWEFNGKIGAEKTQMASLREQEIPSSIVRDLEKRAAPETGAVSNMQVREDSSRKNEEAASPELEGQMADLLSQRNSQQALQARREKDKSAAASPQPAVKASKTVDEVSVAAGSAPSEAPVAAPAPPPASAENKEVKLAGGVAGREVSKATGMILSASPDDSKGIIASPGGNMVSSFSATAPAQQQYAAAGKAGLTVHDVRYPAPRPPRRWRYERPPVKRPGEPFNTEAYDAIQDNPFLDVTENPLSTFSIDVDTAS